MMALQEPKACCKLLRSLQIMPCISLPWFWQTSCQGSGAKDDGTSVAESVVNTSDPTARFMAGLFRACLQKFMSFDVFFVLPVDIVRWCRFCTCTFLSTNLLPAHICPALL
jgi:hypothetical protein